MAEAEGHTSLHLPQYVQAEKSIISRKENSSSSDDLSSVDIIGAGWLAIYILTGGRQRMKQFAEREISNKDEA